MKDTSMLGVWKFRGIYFVTNPEQVTEENLNKAAAKMKEDGLTDVEIGVLVRTWKELKTKEKKDA